MCSGTRRGWTRKESGAGCCCGWMQDMGYGIRDLNGPVKAEADVFSFPHPDTGTILLPHILHALFPPHLILP
ncbi:hypothetical protein BJ165DRAFT_1511399 [Panaeolus papilionaceus]|nr:hypothetical protein BJ165DRAFT_1511399 [Panaeolus papilionaceus]